jgi:hypothetical protein
MKTFLLAIFLLFGACFGAESQTGKPIMGIKAPIVDERVELISIAARLAGYREYNMSENKRYVQDIHQYFDQYKDHSLIQYMREIRETNSLGYNQVAAMAIHLTPVPDLKPIVEFTDDVPDPRWGLKTALKFDTLLKRFYNDTHFDQFFKAHQSMYKVAAFQFDSLYRQLDLNWYHQYYGVKPRGTFNIVIGLSNGEANYGPKVIHPDGEEDLYAIMGAWKFNDSGIPSFTGADYLPILVHEFNHSFVNYLTDENKGRLQASATIIYQAVSNKMQRLAYGSWQPMMSEALVRASVIKYLQSHYRDSTIAIKEFQIQRAAGFIWIQQLVDLLGQYEADRKSYPTLESFMPRIIEFYATLSENIDKLMSDYKNKQPHVISFEPALNGDTTIQPTLKQLKVYFDKPLSGKGISINYGKLGKDHYPGVKLLGYTDSNKTILLQVDLKPGTNYDFILTGQSFTTIDGYPLENYEVTFKTNK